MDSLKQVFSLVRETRKILRDFPKIRQIQNKCTRLAVLSFVTSTCDTHTRAVLSGFCQEMNSSDGISSLRHLQSLCAPQDDDALRSDLNHFNVFSLCAYETIQRLLRAL